jgi:hypothetical protein
MKTNKQSNNISNNQSSSTSTAPKARTKAKLPPVAMRVTVGQHPAATPGATGSGVAVRSPPQVAIPPVPAGFVPVPLASLRGFRPMATEVKAVSAAVTELQGMTDYGAIFGITAPPVDQVIQLLQVAEQWTELLAASSAWEAYVKSEEGVAWKDALQVVEKLKTPFQLATTANPALSARLPELAKLLGASKAAAKKGSSTKSKNQATADTPPAGGTEATQAVTPEATPTVAPAPTRVVTVQG